MVIKKSVFHQSIHLSVHPSFDIYVKANFKFWFKACIFLKAGIKYHPRMVWIFHLYVPLTCISHTADSVFNNILMPTTVSVPVLNPFSQRIYRPGIQFLPTMVTTRYCNFKNMTRPMANCTCSDWGWWDVWTFFSHLSFLTSFSLSLGDGLI